MDDKLLTRFLNRCCTPEELERIHEWIASDPAHAATLFEIETIHSLKNELRFSSKKETEPAYRRLAAQIKEKNTPLQRPAKSFRTRWLGYAAAVLFLVVLSITLYRLTGSGAPELNIIEVPDGQRASVILSDGTRVWLNSRSKLAYPSRFSGRKRTVRLEGEGFFEVTRNEKAAFTVQSDLLEVKVLGTKFNMKAYPDEISRVTLAEGKVEVTTNDGKGKTILRPNEQVSYSAGKKMHLKRTVNTELVKSWTTGEIAYTDKTLNEIAADLERRFGISIAICDPELASEIFTCHFGQSTTVEEVLNLLKETRKLDYRHDGENIRIYKPLK